MPATRRRGGGAAGIGGLFALVFSVGGRGRTVKQVVRRGTSKGEIEDRGASSPSWGLVSLEVGLLPTSSGCGLELLLVLWEIGVYRTILFSLSSLPELKSNDSSWEDSTSGLAVVWSSPSVWRLVNILLAVVVCS